MASILAADLPSLQDNFNVQFMLPNKLMEDQLKLGKPKLIKFLRESLNNFGITIKVVVNETVEKIFAYTPELGSGGDGFVGFQCRGNVGRLAPCHAIVIGGHVARAIAFRIGGPDGQASEFVATAGKNLIEKEDATGLGFLDEAGVIAAIRTLFVGDFRLGPRGAFVLGEGDHQVVAGLVGRLVASFGDGEQRALLRA